MSDIKIINGKYYDFSEVNNPSFILTAKELQAVGIKNYYFMLEIKEPRLADIDPFSTNMTKSLAEALMDEYKKNMWWFMRTAVRLRTDKGIVPYTLHRGLAAAAWCFNRHQDHCLCEPRQTYKTTETIAGPLQWAFQLSKNLHMHFYGKETDNTKRNLNYLKSDIELLPEWLQFRRYVGLDGKVKKARASTEVLMNNLLGNDLSIYPKPSSLSHAQSIGRGGTGAIIYYDEIEHTPFFGEILSNSGPLFKTASENAAEVGAPYCRIFTCTPGNLDTKEGAESYPIIKSMIPWSEKIYDMTDQEIAEYKDAFRDEYSHSEEDHTRDVIDVFYIEYQYYQLRRTYKWVQEQYALSGDKMAVRREILLQRLRGSNRSPISPEDIEILISNMVKSDDDIIINGKWRFRLYDHGQKYQFGRDCKLDPDIPYLVGVDPAGGGGGKGSDNFAVTVVNPYNLQVAAEFKSPYISGPAAVQMLVTLVEDYIPNSVLCIEKNSMGITIIQMIAEQTSIRDNMYWSEKAAAKQIEELAEEGPEDYELRSMAAQYRKYGTYNVGKVRATMLEILFSHVENCKQILTTEYLVDDICKLERTRTGRIQAVAGEHDDCLFSYLHAMYVYYYGDNLEHFGIIKGDHPVLGAIQSDIDKKLEEKNAFINGFFSTKQSSFNEYVMEDAARLEAQVKEMVDKLSFVNDSVYSKAKNDQDPYGNSTVSLPAYFFDELNSW